jgi:5'-nucleotidase / UDP-sugar diphosphatase
VLTDDPVKKVGGMIQVSGISFTYEPGQQFGSRVRKVLVGGKPLQAQQKYRIVTNEMLAGGGHNYRAFTRGTDARELESQYEIIERAFRKRGRITAPESGRVGQVISEKT